MKRMQWRFHVPQALIDNLGWKDGERLYLIQDGNWLKVRKHHRSKYE